MALQPIYKRLRDDGTLQVVYSDGSTRTFDANGGFTELSSTGPNENLAAALATGNDLQSNLAQLDAFSQTQWYKDLTDSQQQQAATAASQWDKSFGLQSRTATNTRDYQQGQLKNSARGLDIQEELGQGDLTYKNRSLDAQIAQAERAFGLDQGKLGLSYLQAAIQAGEQPSDYFQQQDLIAGASARQDVPIFVQRLLSGVNPQTAGTAPGGIPTPQTAEGLLARLSGGSPDQNLKDANAIAKAMPPSTDTGLNDHDKAALNAIGAVYARGSQALGSGSLENMDQNTLGLLSSGGRKLGWDPQQFVRDYYRTRLPGQNSSAWAA